MRQGIAQRRRTCWANLLRRLSPPTRGEDRRGPPPVPGPSRRRRRHGGHLAGLLAGRPQRARPAGRVALRPAPRPRRQRPQLPEGFTSRIVAVSLAAGAGHRRTCGTPSPTAGPACPPTTAAGSTSRTPRTRPRSTSRATELLAIAASAVPGCPRRRGRRDPLRGRRHRRRRLRRPRPAARATAPAGSRRGAPGCPARSGRATRARLRRRRPVWECDPFGGPRGRPAGARPLQARDGGRRPRPPAALPVARTSPTGSSTGTPRRPGTWGSGAALEGGVLEAMAVGAGGAVTLVPVADADPAAPTAPLRTTRSGGDALRRRRGPRLRRRARLPHHQGRRPGLGPRRRRPR